MLRALELDEYTQHAGDIRDLQLEYLREMQSIIARATPNEGVGLLCLHLLDLREGDGNALAD